MAANPISSYSYTQLGFHSGNPATYNSTVKATAPFIATGSYVNSSAFYVSGSAGATVTLVNGGQFQIPAGAAATPVQVFTMSVYSVDSGTVYLLYR